jgi:alkylation response protein AidB-like acyl-CoA dehydrogenase
MNTAAASGDMDIHQQLRDLLTAGKGHLPLPGGGHTLERWRALADVAALDLSLVKFFEGHTDALAILAELAPAYDAGQGLWAVWASELPGARVVAEPAGTGQLCLKGTKGWCSGAARVDRALVTVWSPQGMPYLAAVTLRQPGVTVIEGGWEAVGMAATESLSISFDGALADIICTGDGYLARHCRVLVRRSSPAG